MNIIMFVYAQDVDIGYNNHDYPRVIIGERDYYTYWNEDEVITGNWTFLGGVTFNNVNVTNSSLFCLNGVCYTNLSSDLYAHYIRTNGLSTTTASIPFAQGLVSNNDAQFNGVSGDYLLWDYSMNGLCYNTDCLNYNFLTALHNDASTNAYYNMLDLDGTQSGGWTDQGRGETHSFIQTDFTDSGSCVGDGSLCQTRYEDINTIFSNNVNPDKFKQVIYSAMGAYNDVSFNANMIGLGIENVNMYGAYNVYNHGGGNPIQGYNSVRSQYGEKWIVDGNLGIGGTQKRYGLDLLVDGQADLSTGMSIIVTNSGFGSTNYGLLIGADLGTNNYAIGIYDTDGIYFNIDGSQTEYINSQSSGNIDFNAINSTDVNSGEFNIFSSNTTIHGAINGSDQFIVYPNTTFKSYVTFESGYGDIAETYHSFAMSQNIICVNESILIEPNMKFKNPEYNKNDYDNYLACLDDCDFNHSETQEEYDVCLGRCGDPYTISEYLLKDVYRIEEKCYLNEIYTPDEFSSGDVVCFDTVNNARYIKLCDQQYSTLFAGIISENPNMIIEHHKLGYNVAEVGAVQAKCVNDFNVGDVLTTSNNGKLKKLNYALVYSFLVNPETFEISAKALQSDHAIALTNCINGFAEVKIK